MTMLELVKHCLEHKDTIFIRAKIDGEWDLYPISAITGNLMLNQLIEWYNNNVIPHYVRKEENDK